MKKTSRADLRSFLVRAALVGALPAACVAGCSSDDGPSPGREDVSVADVADDAVDTSDAAETTDDAADTDEDADTPPELLTSYERPTAPIEVLVDEEGIPHLYAQNDLDLFWGSGYWQASQILFDIDIAVRAARGTLSEVFGAEGESGDIQAATIGFLDIGERSVATLQQQQPETWNLLVAFADGINAYVDDVLAQRVPLPEPFERFDFAPQRVRPVDLLGHGYRIQFGFSSSLEYDLLNTLVERLNINRDVPVFRQGLPAYIMFQGPLPEGRSEQKSLPPPVSFDDAEPLDEAEVRAMIEGILRYRRDLSIGDGSNGWIIAPEHSFNGRPIVANDSHSTLFDPNRMFFWHLNSADAGGTFDTIGFSFVGIPSIQLGHNRRLAWAATTNFADQMDLWSVPVRNNVATWGDAEVALEVESRSFQVRQRDGSLTERVIQVRRLPGVGPLLPPALLPVPRQLLADGEIVVGWPGFLIENDELAMFTNLARAETIPAFRDAVRLQRTGMQNWKAATVDDMGYQTSGFVPDRGPVDGRPRAGQILDGRDASTHWTGNYLPPERLPALDGDRPFIVTANNDPWGHTDDNNPYNDEFYYAAFYSPGMRAGWIMDRLREQVADGVITPEMTWELQNDPSSVALDLLRPSLEATRERLDDGDDALAAFADDEALRDALDRLIAFDGRLVRASSDAALYRIWMAWLQKTILEDDLSLLFTAIDGAQPVMLVKYATLAVNTPIPSIIGGDLGVQLLTSLRAALDAWLERDEPTFGDIHLSRFGSADRTSYTVPTDGCDTAPNVAQCSFFASDGSLADVCIATMGAVFRNVTTFDEDGTPRMIYNFTGGTAQQLDDWIESVPRPALFRRAEIEAATVTTVRIGE